MENRMNVLMLNGSPRTNGNIALAFQEMEQVFRENGCLCSTRNCFLENDGIG